MSSVADEFADIGEGCLARGDLDGAEEAYRDAIGADRNSVRALYGLAATLSRRRHWPEAIDYGRRALELDASHVGVRALLGVGLLRQEAAVGLSGQSAEEEAVSHLLFAADHGAGAAIRMELASAYERLERWEDAAQQLRLALEEGPGDRPLAVDLEVPRAADLHFALSRVLAESGWHDEAQEQYERGLQLDPHIQLRDWYQFIATEFDAEQDPAAALSEDDQEARDARLIRQLLMVMSYEALTIAAANERLRGLDVTVANYIFAMQRAGNFVLSAQLRVIGDCLIGQGAAVLYEFVHSDAGRMLLGLAEAVHADAAQLETAERRAAVVHLPTDHVEPLIGLVERFVRLDPESGAPVAEVAATALAQAGRGGACRYILADARYRHGDLGGARQSLTQAIPQLEQEGNVAGLLDALARMAGVESALDRFAQAVDVLGRLIVTAEQHDELGRAGVARCNRAIDLFKLGDAHAAYDEARSLAEAVVADDMLREQIGRQVAAPLAEVLNQAGAAISEAVPAELLSGLAMLDDNATDALLDLAYEHLQAGRTDEAIALLKPAADSGTAATAVLAALGQAFAMAGDIVQAEDYLHEALSQRRQGRSGDADLWPVLFTLAEVIRESGDSERAIGWLSQALDVALTDPDPERQKKTLTALSFAFVDVDPDRAVAIAGRVYSGGIDPSSPLVELARTCRDEWSAKRYPGRQLDEMRQLLDTTPVDGRWVQHANLVAETAVEVGAEPLAVDFAKKVIEVVAAHEWGDISDDMKARSVLGRAHRIRGRYEQARAEYERAAEIAEMVFDVRAEADVRGRLAIVLRHLDRPDLAILQYRQAIRIAERLDEAGDAAVARSNLVYSLLAVGREAEAISCAQQAIADSRRSEQPDLANYGLRLLAHHVASSKLPADLSDAITALPTTIESEPGTFRWLYEHLHRAARLIDRGETATAVRDLRAMLAYTDEHGNTSIRESAQLESARTLAVIDAELAWTAARQALTTAIASKTHVLFLADCRQLLLDLALANGRDGEIEQLVADLLADWARLRQMLPEDADRVAVADRAVRHLHGAVLHYLATDPARAFALWDTARAPALAEAITPTPTTGRRAAHVLSLGLIGEEAVAMVASPDRPEPVVIRTGLGQGQLDQLMGTFRREMHVFHGHGAGTWMRLAAPLLAGAAEHLPPDGLVIAVVDATLQELPLHAVPMPNGEPLIARCAVAYAPSLAVLDALDARAAVGRTGRSILTIGVAFPDEARAVTARFGGVCRSGTSLGKISLREDIEAADLLHFACHSQFDSEIPINSGLVLATSRQPVPDEILSIRDLSAWALDAGLVTLSACDTALGIASPSELLGLARSFLRIGANSVLAALWKIDDAATQRLMLDFYAELFRANVNGRLDTARALRATQLRHAAGYPPHAWAGFKLIGLPSMAWQEPTQ